MIWLLITILGIAAIALTSLGVWQLRQKRLAKQKTSTFKITPSRPQPQQPLHAFGSGCNLIFGLAWTSFSLVFVVIGLGVGVREWSIYTLLRDNGVTIQAEVTNRRIVEDSEGSTHYITYAYTAPLPQGDRDNFINEESVSRQTYQELSIGTQVSIRYAANQPETARLTSKSNTAAIIFPIAFGLFGGLFALLGIAVISDGVKSMAQVRRLTHQGVTTQAQIIERWTEKDSDGDPRYCVSYRFTAPGHPEIFKAEYNREIYDLLDTKVSVRYLPNKPEICRLEA